MWHCSGRIPAISHNDGLGLKYMRVYADYLGMILVSAIIQSSPGQWFVQNNARNTLLAASQDSIRCHRDGNVCSRFILNDSHP